MLSIPEGIPNLKPMASSDQHVMIRKNFLRSDAIHDYIMDTYVYPREHGLLKRIREETIKYCVKQGDGRMALMGVPPDEAQHLAMLLKLMDAKKTIELGVFTGYSLLATALALPDDGKVTAIDIDRAAFEVGLPFMREAGVEHKIDFINSDALSALDEMHHELYDFAFVDADKPSYGEYHDRLAELVRVGGVIAYDNTLWYGSVVSPDEPVFLPVIKEQREFVVEFNRKLAADSRFEISLLAIGDGVTICRRLW